jgi:hypothetical protein
MFLLPDSGEARICGNEGTLWANCVDSIPYNVCPSRARGFDRRPVGPMHNWPGDNDLADYPAATFRKYGPVELLAHGEFAKPIKAIPANRR